MGPPRPVSSRPPAGGSWRPAWGSGGAAGVVVPVAAHGSVAAPLVAVPVLVTSTGPSRPVSSKQPAAVSSRLAPGSGSGTLPAGVSLPVAPPAPVAVPVPVASTGAPSSVPSRPPAVVSSRLASGSGAGAAVGSALESAVGSALGSAVASALGSAVASALGSAVASALGLAVASALGSAVGSALGSAGGSALGSAGGSALGSAVAPTPASAGGAAAVSVASTAPAAGSVWSKPPPAVWSTPAPSGGAGAWARATATPGRAPGPPAGASPRTPALSVAAASTRSRFIVGSPFILRVRAHRTAGPRARQSPRVLSRYRRPAMMPLPR